MKKQQTDNFTKEQEEVEVIMMNNLPLDNSFEWREEVAKEIIDKVLKSSLQEQREAILKDIEKRERRIKESLPSLTNINKGYNQALEDIKQIIIK